MNTRSYRKSKRCLSVKEVWPLLCLAQPLICLLYILLQVRAAAYPECHLVCQWGVSRLLRRIFTVLHPNASRSKSSVMTAWAIPDLFRNANWASASYGATRQSTPRPLAAYTHTQTQKVGKKATWMERQKDVNQSICTSLSVYLYYVPKGQIR